MAQTINPTQVRGTATVQTPTSSQSVNQPAGTFDKHNAFSADGNFATANAGNLTIHAWGNSQTQGAGLPGCPGLTCHPDTAWPAVFAAKMGWALDNQAYGSSNCADLTYQGTSESIWDEQIDTSSRNIYGHFRNDQGQYGPLPYRVDFARGCIAAQTLWLALPEVNKRRANGGYHDRTGVWVDGAINSTTSTTIQPGATMTFYVTGKTVYIATARVFNPNETTYTISVGGVPVYDPTTKSYSFTQGLDHTQDPAYPVNENVIPYLIRIPGLRQQTWAVTYTCTSVGTGNPCMVFFAAGSSPDNSTANGPFVYSLSPLNNSDAQSSGFFDQSITSAYFDEWSRMISEFNGDGLQIVGIDALNKNVYDPNTDTQPDGVHPSVAGAAKIAAIAISKATAASTPLDRSPSALINVNQAYSGIGAGPAPSPSAAGSTNPTYLIPKGSLWSSTGPDLGRMYMGYDGTTYFNRIPDDPTNTFNLGIGHVTAVGSVDSLQTNFAAPGQVTSTWTSTDAGGRVRALNDSVTLDLLAEGANGDSQPDWSSNGIINTNRNLIQNSDLGLIQLQIGRVKKFELTAGSLNLDIPLTIGSVGVPTVITPNINRAACIKSAGPPPVIGTCSTQPDATGSCTCN
jgi:hypothetical protein